MESIAFFFFTIRLSLTLMSELIFVLLRLLIGTKTFLLSFFLFLLLIGSASVQIVFKTPPPLPLIITLKDRQAAETRISFWESLVTSSPNRDSFLNLEKLYRYLNEEDRAKLFRKRAFSLDPANPVFQNDDWLWQEELPASTSAISN
ncbi:MAG: hypothetical protein ABI425_03230 [Patescibacteria group bacterium]